MIGKPSLLDHVRRCLRIKHHSICTEPAYVDWIKRFILFHVKRHPSYMGSDEIRQFLSHPASKRVSPSEAASPLASPIRNQHVVHPHI